MNTASMDASLSNKKIVLDAFTALFVEFDPEQARKLLAKNYIQHNPFVPTGLEPILSAITLLRESGLKPTIHRVIAEADLVALHVTYENAEFFGASVLVGFDIFRVENGLVAEHWDNLQAPPRETASGRLMTDGKQEPSDLHQTESNKALATDFVQEVFLEGRLEKAGDYIVSTPGAYLQHNPLVRDGLDELGKALMAMAEAGNGFSFSALKLVVAEGDMVLTVTEGKVGDVPSAFYDLWRIQEGLIVEHWDVIAEIPAEMAHENGKF